MIRTWRLGLVSLLLLLTAFARPVVAQNGPPPEIRRVILALEHMLEAQSDATLREFAGAHVSASYGSSMTETAMLSHLRGLQAAVGGPIKTSTIERTADAFELTVTGSRRAVIAFTLDEDFRVSSLSLRQSEIVDQPDDAPARSRWTGLTWDNVAARFREFGANGLRGVVLIVHDGTPLLRESFGRIGGGSAERIALNTMFDIGSAPIDFTMTGISILAQRGRIALSDPVAKHLAGVPAAMQAITIEQLMSGASGLPDFHGIAANDWDPDLQWIDRQTALDRIFSQSLLFAPGTDRAHSHSAFAVLAAVIEVVSGSSYRDFVRAEILTPLGMTRTGFYGERAQFAITDFAVGDGPGVVGLPNIPPNWGPTSWLVMGSGGMYSSLDDMARYFAALSAGKDLDGEWARRRNGATLAVGGTDRGFFMFHVADGRGNRVLGLTAADGQTAEMHAMLGALRDLVLPR